LIFIDTGAFLARYVERDQHHQRSTAYWKELESAAPRCFTSNFVIDELITLLSRRASSKFAAQRARQLYASNVLEILRPDENMELAALELLNRFADQQLSFTDCVSFALMQSIKVTKAFTFDHHFAIAGFEMKPVSQ
jgi:predicted nucleic acid-binding protein